MTQNRSSAVMQQRSEPNDIVTMDEARALGLRWYFTGVPCPRGHVAKRSLSNRDCRACGDARRGAKDSNVPGRARERNVKRYHKDVEASRAKVRDAYQRNAEARRADDAARYYGDAERRASVKQRAVQWGRDNPGKRNRIIAARRAWVKRATPAWLTDEDRQRITAIYLEAASFGPGVMHVDHRVPLRGKLVCGLHVPGNLQIIPALTNIRKGNRYGSE